MTKREPVNQTCECGATRVKEWDEYMTLWEQFSPELIQAFTCDECEGKRQKSERDERRIKWRQEWIDRTIPPIYQDTNLAHESLDRTAIQLVLSWDFKIGIGLIGDTGKGKTRLLYHALTRAYDGGITGRAISHNAFSVLVVEVFAGESKKDARQKLDNIRNADILLIDDVGKAPRTERADAEFEELVEHRVSRHLPILWSANAGGQWLENRFGEDRGPALVRRLAQFCTCLTLR